MTDPVIGFVICLAVILIIPSICMLVCPFVVQLVL
jgi:hypothetical protein